MSRYFGSGLALVSVLLGGTAFWYYREASNLRTSNHEIRAQLEAQRTTGTELSERIKTRDSEHAVQVKTLEDQLDQLQKARATAEQKLSATAEQNIALEVRIKALRTDHAAKVQALEGQLAEVQKARADAEQKLIVALEQINARAQADGTATKQAETKKQKEEAAEADRRQGAAAAAATARKRAEVGPAPSDPMAKWRAEISDKLIQPYRDGEEALARYCLAPGCDSPDRTEVLRCIHVLETIMSMERQMADEMRRAPTDSVVQEKHAGLSFDFATESFRRGCLDDADSTYRGLIEMYVGAAYSGIRDRARMGVEDVRAARAAQDKKP